MKRVAYNLVGEFVSNPVTHVLMLAGLLMWMIL
jgi:hypothetical protein